MFGNQFLILKTVITITVDYCIWKNKVSIKTIFFVLKKISKNFDISSFSVSSPTTIVRASSESRDREVGVHLRRRLGRRLRLRLLETSGRLQTSSRSHHCITGMQSASRAQRTSQRSLRFNDSVSNNYYFNTVVSRYPDVCPHNETNSNVSLSGH